jgi:hypothetical protein
MPLTDPAPNAPCRPDGLVRHRATPRHPGAIATMRPPLAARRAAAGTAS